MTEAAQRKWTLGLVQEPYIGGVGKMKNYAGVRIVQCGGNSETVTKAAILIFDTRIDLIPNPLLTTTNFAVAKIKSDKWEIGVVSMYLESDKPIEPYIQWMRKIVSEIGTNKVILGGDVNAWNIWWGSKRNNTRGETLAEALEELNFHILNQGTEATFDTIRGGKRYTSWVDLTACSSDMLGRIENWKVNGEIINSDHKAILFQINLNIIKALEIKRTTRLYNTKKANWCQFREKLTSIWNENNINSHEIGNIDSKLKLEAVTVKITKAIINTCDKCIPKISNNKRRGLPWWTRELSQMKKDVLTKKRRITYAASVRRAWVVEEYLQAKINYLKNVKEAQTSSWKRFCEKQSNESMWDGIYRVIGRTKAREEDIPLIKDGKVLTTVESAGLLADTFYPQDDINNDNPFHTEMRIAAVGVNDELNSKLFDPPFTEGEMKGSANSFNLKKAPGSDGLTADICLAAITLAPDVFLKLYNKCLELSCFPTIWKEAIVVVLRKPAKQDYSHPKSYRPIGLLSILGKILEKMIIKRINWYILPDLCPRQFGFVPQKSTEDALYAMMNHVRNELNNRKIIVLVSLDIEGAFDSAWWPAIKCRLADSKCPVNLRRMVDDYFYNRKVRVRYAGAECLRKTTLGCVQGSIGGPTFWNLMLDPLLKELEGMGEYCQAFADDIVLIFSGRTAVEIQRRANASLEHVRTWGIKHKLKFAPHKTQAITITNKIKFDTPHLVMGGIRVDMSPEIKILGLTIDNKLTFNTHVNNICKKATNIYKQLSKAAKVQWGLNPEVIRTMYTAVIEPVVMYAASAWAPAASKMGVQKSLNSIQRGFGQKIIKSYRTVSLNSALILARLLPLDIRVKEAALLFQIKRGLSSRFVGDREVETPTCHTDIPHPSENIQLEFKSVADCETMDQDDHQGQKIFTDGSKIDGKVGAAISVWNENNTEIYLKKYKLDSYCTVYQAELLALSEASQQALKGNTPFISIYCDSQSALKTVIRHDSLHPLAINTRQNIKKAREQNKIINLFWVKAHIGIKGNERADELAKDAALKLKTKPSYDRCPVSFIKRQIRLESIGEWNHRYLEGNTASNTKVFFPNAITAYNIVHKIDLDPVIVQTITGHGGFSEYLFRFKCKESPVCPCDSETNETALHVITECPIYGKERDCAEMRMGVKINKETIKILLNKSKSRDHFITFCKKITRIVNNKNK